MFPRLFRNSLSKDAKVEEMDKWNEDSSMWNLRWQREVLYVNYVESIVKL